MSVNVFNKKSLKLILIVITIVSIILNLSFICFDREIDSYKWLDTTLKRVESQNCSSIEELNENLSFENLNETGYPLNIVPNIVHYVLFDVTEITFAHFISILSALKNQRPDLIYIHCNCRRLIGRYYRRALEVANKLYIPIIIQF